MGKVCVEVSLISARGLRQSNLLSFFKYQWYAVAWIISSQKSITHIDVSRSTNPVWRSKFATVIEDANANANPTAEGSTVHIEVYRRDPIFLGEKLHGSATVCLREFLDKHSRGLGNPAGSGPEEGTYQLRKNNSRTPRGLVDISIGVSAYCEPTYRPPNAAPFLQCA